VADTACGSIREPDGVKLLIGRSRLPPPEPDRTRGARSPPRRAPPYFFRASPLAGRRPASHRLTECDRGNRLRSRIEYTRVFCVTGFRRKTVVRTLARSGTAARYPRATSRGRRVRAGEAARQGRPDLADKNGARLVARHDVRRGGAPGRGRRLLSAVFFPVPPHAGLSCPVRRDAGLPRLTGGLLGWATGIVGRYAQRESWDDNSKSRCSSATWCLRRAGGWPRGTGSFRPAQAGRSDRRSAKRGAGPLWPDDRRTLALCLRSSGQVRHPDGIGISGAGTGCHGNGGHGPA
jgi:hypothetical protein